MATTKIWDVRGRIDKPLNYATNPNKTINPDFNDSDLQGLRDVMDYAKNDFKTEKQYYVSGLNCSPEIARQEMMITKKQYGKTGGIIAYHSYQSFAEKEVTPEVAHEIGIKLAKELWGDRFDEMVVFKDLKKSNFFSALSLPSFLRDWLLKKFEDDNGEFKIEELSEFINEYLPKKDDWVSIKDRVVIDNERVKFLAKISIDIDIRTQEVSFALPDFGLINKQTIIESNVWDDCKSELVKGKETWGVIELGYRFPENPKTPGKIKLTSFKNFCPYTVDLDYYKDVRSEFTTEEWVDVILGAIDYNAAGYKDSAEKLAMITRLLPFVEKRLNLIELAPKGRSLVIIASFSAESL